MLVKAFLLYNVMLLLHPRETENLSFAFGPNPSMGTWVPSRVQLEQLLKSSVTGKTKEETGKCLLEAGKWQINQS